MVWRRGAWGAAACLTVLPACGLLFDTGGFTGSEEGDDAGASTRDTMDAGRSGTSEDAGATGEPSRFGPVRSIATGQLEPRGLALDAERVFWTTVAGTVSSAPKGGGDPRLVASGEGRPLDVLVVGAQVCWSRLDGFRDSAVRCAPKAGGNAGTAGDIGTYTGSARLVTDGSAAWLAAKGTVCRFPFPIGSPVETALFTSQSYLALASDGVGVFLATSSQLFLGKRDGSAPSPFAGEAAGIADVRVDGTHVYYATAAGSLMRREKGRLDAPPEMLAEGQPGLARIAIDEGSVYFTAGGASIGEGIVGRVPKSGGSVVEIASKLRMPFALAVDASGVFFSTLDDGAVWTAPRL